MKIQIKPEKKSFLRRLQEFFIFILLIPVSTASATKDFKLNFFSCRVLLGFIIWALGPLVCFLVSVLPKVSNLWNNSKLTAVYLTISMATEYTEVLLVIFLPFCSAKLLQHCNQFTQDKLKFPANKVSLGSLLLLLVYPIIKLLIDQEFETLGLVAHFVYLMVSMIDTMVSIFLINMMLSTMASACKNIRIMEDPDMLGDEAIRITSMYRSLKTGLGPSLLFFFSLGVFLITALAYLSTAGPPGYMLHYAFVLGKNILLLANLSFACDDCYSELLATRDIIRSICI